MQLKDIEQETATGKEGGEKGEVAEQVRVEEIRAQLQEVRVKAKEAAKGGDTKDKEEEKKKVVTPAETGGAAGAQGGEGKKWISPRLRQAQATGGAGSGGGGGGG
ncbi:hypothetical protein TrRE_jg332, partial [Triparma retinervis]